MNSKTKNFLLSLPDLFQNIGIDNAIVVIPSVFAAAFAFSLLASFIMSKIPLLKKIV